MSIEEPKRTRLPDVRAGITHKRTACGIEFYTTVNFYEVEDHTCRPAEVFVILGQHGDIVAGLVDGVCITASLALQYGVPWSKIRSKFIGQKFGADDAKGIHTSILDGIAQSVDECIRQYEDRVGIYDSPADDDSHSPAESE